MNKKAKIAMAAVSVVMAGTMALGIVGCTPPEEEGGWHDDGVKTGTIQTGGTAYNSTASSAATAFLTKMNGTYNLNSRVSINAAGYATAASYWNTILKPTGDIAVPTAGPEGTYTDNTQIGIAIGHNNDKTGAFYGEIDGSVVVPGGYTASTGTIKPAFKALQDALKVSFVNKYTGKEASKNLEEFNKTGGTWGTEVDICTANLTNAVDAANADASKILDLGAYLDKMPNFKYFLETNPIVYMSLVKSNKKESEGAPSSKTDLSLYCAPYFDGNDDIERYCLIRQDWVETLLDGTLAKDGDYYKQACSNDSVYCTSFMGTTGNYEILTTNSTGSGTFTLKKDYDAAKTAVTTANTPLNTAYKAIAGEEASYTGASGNIVDIMNDAISKNLYANGKQLVALYKAYIDAAYKNGNAAAYTKHSELFNGYNAAWDVDDLVAMLRIVKTNSENLGLEACSTEGIFPRDATNDRTPDIVRLVCQLYGERGADSRYESTYIAADGTLKDMRSNASFYDALTNLGNMAKEGLVVDYVNGGVSAGDLKGNCTSAKPGYGFMMYDYSQTQTTQMYDKAAGSKYLFGAINTPVSRWDTDTTAGKETVMRFTESWRSTKTGGLVVAGAVANNENKLNAVLAFIDYLYSNDGQILSTFGIQSTNGNTATANGTWYGNEVATDAAVAAIVAGQTKESVTETRGGQLVVKEAYKDKFFTFGNKLYTGTDYLGKQTPIITDTLYEGFLQNSGPIKTQFNSRGSFTGFARAVLGATLPMGVKDQSFENQLTAPDAAACATKVSVSLANGTIKHVELNPTTNPWYTSVPTALPFTSTQTANLNNAETQGILKTMCGSFSNKNNYSIFHHIIFNGYTGTYSRDGVNVVLGS